MQHGDIVRRITEILEEVPPKDRERVLSDVKNFFADDSTATQKNPETVFCKEFGWFSGDCCD